MKTLLRFLFALAVLPLGLQAQIAKTRAALDAEAVALPTPITRAALLPLLRDVTASATIPLTDGTPPSTAGSYANPSWITSLAWSKISTTPTTLAGYGITDGVTTDASLLTSGLLPMARLASGTGLQVLRRNSANTALEFATISVGGGDVLASNNLSDLTNFTTARTNLGLGNVDNTSDANKPISTAETTALAAKVAGPASAVSGNIAIFSGTSGKIISDSGAVALTGVATSAGAADAGKVQVLNASGLHDVSSLPALTGDVTKAAGTGATVLPVVNSTVGTYTNATVTVNAKGQVISAANGAGGGGGDVVAVLVNATVTLTATTVLDSTYFSKVVHLNPTSADIVITLPAVASNGGKSILFIVDSTATKIATLTGNAAETIDTSNTRIVHDGESAHLLCDGTTWAKIGGKSVAMGGVALRNHLTAPFTYTNNTSNTIPLDVNSSGNLYSSNRGGCLKVKRPGNYVAFAFTSADAGSPTYFNVYPAVNTLVTPIQADISKSGATILVGGIGGPLVLAAGDECQVGVYPLFSGSVSNRIYTGSEPTLTLVEVPSW